MDNDRDNKLEHVQTDPTNINEKIRTPLPPPIIIVDRTTDFLRFRSNLIKFIDPDNFVLKLSTGNVNILTKNSSDFFL